MAAPGTDFWTNAAFWTASAAFLSFVLSKVYEIALRRFDYWEGRKAAIVRFKTDIRLRREDLLSKQAAYSDPEYRVKIVGLIEQHAAETLPFRLYGVEVTDTKAHEEITTYLATFPEPSQILIRQVVLRDRQMIALYTMMTTSDFETLRQDRKIEAFDRWIDSVNALITSLEALNADLPNWRPKPWAAAFRFRRSAGE